MSTSRTLLTADDLMRLSSLNKGVKRLELVKGELLEMPPAGGRHGRVASRVDYRLRSYVEPNDLGEVFAAETGFWISHDPDTVRAPDASFVAKGRLPAGEPPTGYLDLAPDLAVEVVSPGDTAGEVQAKVEDWLRAGVRLVWVFYPDTRSVAIYGGLHDVRVLTEQDELDGGQVLPGFRCRVRELF
jgi:Uma2 family endonuclease